VLIICCRSSTSPFEGYYLGKLSDGRAVTFRLQFAETNVNCRIHLQGCPGFDRLTGDRPKNNSFSALQDWPDRGDTLVVKLRGSFSRKPAVFSGSLSTSNPVATINFTATKIASCRALHVHRGFKFGDRGGGVTYDAAFPVFLNTNAFLAAISRQLASEARAGMKDFSSNGYSLAWDGFKEKRSFSYSWEGFDNVDIACVFPGLASLYDEVYEYTGGAHGNSGIEGRNFIFVAGKLDDLKLPDLFNQKTTWEKTLCAACARELRLCQASDLMSERPKHLTAKDLENFTLDAGGMSFHFSPYEVGSYAEGSFHILIRWSELRPFLDANGPARFIPGALPGPP